MQQVTSEDGTMTIRLDPEEVQAVQYGIWLLRGSKDLMESERKATRDFWKLFHDSILQRQPNKNL